MGYFTYRLFREVSLETLVKKVEANLALYEAGSVGKRLQVTAFQGDGCSALLMGYLNQEESVLWPIGLQFGCIWMDVRYQDGDWWDLTAYEGPKHRVSHSVNPWANDPHVAYDQRRIDHRINRICELWPRQGDTLRPYLLPWRVPSRWLGRRRLVSRAGKAYETDKHGYGDADQINDFIGRFGITPTSQTIVIKSSD